MFFLSSVVKLKLVAFRFIAELPLFACNETEYASRNQSPLWKAFLGRFIICPWSSWLLFSKDMQYFGTHPAWGAEERRWLVRGHFFWVPNGGCLWDRDPKLEARTVSVPRVRSTMWDSGVLHTQFLQRKHHRGFAGMFWGFFLAWVYALRTWSSQTAEGQGWDALLVHSQMEGSTKQGPWVLGAHSTLHSRRERAHCNAG